MSTAKVYLNVSLQITATQNLYWSCKQQRVTNRNVNCKKIFLSTKQHQYLRPAMNWSKEILIGLFGSGFKTAAPAPPPQEGLVNII